MYSKYSSQSLPIVFFFYEMVTSSERNEMSVVGRGGYGDRPRAPNVRVAQLISQRLIGNKVIQNILRIVAMDIFS